METCAVYIEQLSSDVTLRVFTVEELRQLQNIEPEEEKRNQFLMQGIVDLDEVVSKFVQKYKRDIGEGIIDRRHGCKVHRIQKNIHEEIYDKLQQVNQIPVTEFARREFVDDVEIVLTKDGQLLIGGKPHGGMPA